MLNKFNTRNIFNFAAEVLLLAALVFSVIVKDPGHSVIILGLLMVHSILSFKKLMSSLFSFLFVATVILMLLGTQEMLNLYKYFTWYDKIVHFAAEFVLTLLAGYLLIKTNLIEVRSKMIFFIIVVCIGIALGAVWEIVEWILTLYIPPSFEFTAFDTATDLVIDSLGAIVAGIIVVLKFGNNDPRKVS